MERRRYRRRAAARLRASGGCSDAQPLAPGDRAARAGGAGREDHARDPRRPRRPADRRQHGGRPRRRALRAQPPPHRPDLRRGRRARRPARGRDPRLRASRDFGITAFLPGFGFLADVFTEPYLVVWEIDERHARTPELPGVAIPARTSRASSAWRPRRPARAGPQPRAGAGRSRRAVAEDAPADAVPARGGGRAADDPAARDRRQPRRPPARRRLELFLPVDVPGALFSAGDLHFAQGDGEVCGSAIEIAGAVTVRFGVRKQPAWLPRFPRLRDARGPGRRVVRDDGHPAHRRRREWSSTSRPPGGRCWS